MNWRHVLTYLATHGGAAWSLLLAGYSFCHDQTGMLIFWLLLTVFFWLAWKWNEER